MDSIGRVIPSDELMGGRRYLVYSLRREGLTFNEIGKRIGASNTRARQLYGEAEDKIERATINPLCLEGLCTRLVNTLLYHGIHSREDAKKAYDNGFLRPLKITGYGKKSHKEVLKWLGLPDEPTRTMVLVDKMCPHCEGTGIVSIKTWQAMG